MSVPVRIPLELSRIVCTSAPGLRISTDWSLRRDWSSEGGIRSQRAFHQLLRRPLSPYTSTSCSLKIMNAQSQSRWFHVSSGARVPSHACLAVTDDVSFQCNDTEVSRVLHPGLGSFSCILLSGVGALTLFTSQHHPTFQGPQGDPH